MAINLTSARLVGSIADLRTYDGAKLIDTQQFLVSDLNKTTALFRWTTGIAGTEDGQLLVTPTTGGAAGRFVRADNCICLKLPWSFDTPNDTTLITVPTGIRLHVMRAIPEIVVDVDGVDTGSLGLDSNVSLNPGGLAEFTGFVGVGFRGDMGAEIDIPQRTTLVATDVLRHNLLAAGFDAGSGFWHVVCSLIQV